MKLGQLKASIIKAGFFLILGILALSVAMGQVQLSESAEQHSEQHSEQHFGTASLPLFAMAPCVPGTVNRFTGSYHSNLYIGNANGVNVLLAWGQNMKTYTTGAGGDYTAPFFVNTSSYTGIPYEVRSSSTGGASGASVMAMRTSTKFYVFGSTTNISSITSMANFGAASLTNANADVTNKLPAGVGIADVAQFAVSPTAIGIVTTAGNVYMLTKMQTLQGDNAAAGPAIWHQVTLSNGTPLSGVVKFSLSGSGAFALTATGKIYYWGRPANVNGTVNTTTSYNYAYDMSAQIPSGTSVVELVVLGKSTGTNMLFLLGNNLKVYSCGLNDDGVLGVGNASTSFNQPTFQQVTGLSNIVHIDGNTEASLFTMGAMSSTGRIYGWGDGVACMLGIASQSSFTSTYTNTSPVDIFGVDGFMDFSISGHFTIAFFTNPTTAVDQYCYVGHNIGGSIGLPTITAVVISKSAIARLDAPPPISFNCSNSQPTIDITESLTAFSACIGSASASQMIVVAGTSMTNNLTITAPAGFEISTSAGTGYGSTATLTHTGGTIAATNIYIRIVAGSTGTVAGNLVFSSTGATTQNLAITGTVNSLPVIATVTGAVRTGPGSVTLAGTVTPTAGTTIDWFAVSTGGAALSAGVLSYTTGVLNSTTTFFAEARNTSTGCVSTLRVPVIATINGSFSAGAIAANQSICLGATAAAFSSITAASGGTGAISYQWQSSLDNSSFTDIPGATLLSYTPIGLTQTTYYKRLAITVADGSIASNTISITVNPLPIVSLPIDNARTGAGPVLLSATASAGATLDWYASNSGGAILVGGNAVTNFTTASISVTTTYYVEARNSTTGCVSLNRIPVVATINGSFSPGSISADQSFCLGLSAAPFNSVTDASGGTGSISYQWQVSTTSNATGFTDIPAANAIAYAPGAVSQTSYFRRVANTVADGNVYSNVVTIIINPLPSAATAINGSRTGAGVVNIGAVVAAGETTDWYQVPSAGAILSGGTGTNSFNTPSITSTINYYAVARNTTTGCIASARTLVVATIVIPTPVISVSGTLNVFNACIGSVSAEQSFSVSASNLVANLIITAPTGYELSITTGAGFSNSISISPVAGTIASTTIFVRLSNTAVNAASGNIQLSSTNASSVTIATGIATVSALSNAGTISGANTVCAGLNSATLSLSGNLGAILKWQSSADAGFSTSSDIANTSNTQLASNLLTNTYYRAIVQNGYCAQAISAPVLISVNPTPVFTPGIIASISTTATSFSIPFTATNANQYSISVGARALPGFSAINNQALSGTSLVVIIPATAVGAYDFNIIVRNSSTGCIAATVPIVLNIGKQNPTLSLADITKNYNDPIFTIAAVSNSTGAISYTSSNTAVATIVNNQVTIVGAGTSIITATQLADANYNAGSTTVTMVVNKLNPTISLANISKTFGNPDFTIAASSNSTGAISYSIDNPTIASISGNTVHLLASGSATITAIQLADGNFHAASTTALLIVSDLIPSDLSYPSPNFFTIDATISPLFPTVVGVPTAYTISPALPAGLSIHPTTGIISGKPTVYSATKNYTVTASIPAGAATAIVSITVNKINNTLALTNITKSFGDPNFTIAATTNSTGAITYGIANAAVATIAVNNVSIVGAGTSNITASQVEDDKHVAATTTATLTVNKIPASLSLADITKNFGDPAFSISATSNSTGAISYSIDNAAVATTTGNTVFIQGAGSAIITVTQAADANHFAASITAILNVNKIAPVLSFSNIIKTYGDPSFLLNATSTGIGAISYSIDNATIASISGNQVTINAAGTATITVSQAASANHLAAMVTATLLVNKKATLIILADILKTYGDPDFTLNAISDRAGAITYNIANNSLASISGNAVHLIAAGTTTITATQLEDANHLAGTVIANLIINKAATVLSLADIIKTFGDPSFSVNASSNSNGLMTYSIADPSIATVSGNQISIVAAGVTNILVNQAAGTNHLAASITVNLTINKMAATLSLGDIIKTYGDPAFNVNALSNSTGVISYAIANTAVATVLGNTINIVSAGTTTIIANLAADANHNALSVTANLIVNKVKPNLLLNDISKSFGDPDFAISTNSNAPGAFSYTIANPAIATVVGNTIQLHSAGVTSITVQQAASLNYLAATDTANLYVNKISPTIQLADLNKKIGDPDFALNALSNSTGSITYSIDSATIASISGNQVSIQAIGIATITASQSADANYLSGTATATLTVVDVAPSGLSYPGPNVYPVLSAIPALAPTVTGTVTGYTISPALPIGLSMDALTGVISGTPTQATAAIVYTVTASNTAGSISATVSIAVSKLTPTISLSNLSKTMGDPVFGIVATSNSTGAISYASSNASVATIIGNQVSLTGVGVSTLTATQSADAHYLSGTATATLTVNAAAWVGISYPSPNVYTVNTSISPLVPTIGGTATAFVISPALPAGLSISATTGIISGTPTQVSVAKDYTVTATINGNSYTAIVNITVKDIAPNGLSYPSPNVYPVLSAIAALTPTVTGTVTGYTISPALPTGLSMNASTGVISGTPTQATAAIVYTVTASNTAGSISATLSIAVNKLTPTISLNSLTKTKGDPSFGITANSNSTGAISYSSSNASVATISGNQVSLTGVGVTTLTATQTADAHYLAGTANATLTVVDVAPSGLSYPGPNVYPVLSAIAALTPTVTGTVTGYTISPALPIGLSMDASTGVISGTPTQATAAIVYTVTASNTAGSISATVSIAVSKLTPTISLSNLSKTMGDPAFGIAATSNSTGTISYSSSNASVATIIGNQVSLTGVGVSTLTATQVADAYYLSGTATATLTVNAAAWVGISYPSPNVYTVNSSINPLVPTIGGTATAFLISPALPAGLSLSATTGIISGTPTQVSVAKDYTVTATINGSNYTAIVNIAVKDVPPTGLSYPSPNVYPVLSAIAALTPTVNGTVTGYSISPALPTGLSINALTGVISGTPTQATSAIVYTVTSSNTAGSVSATVSIAVNKLSPIISLSNLSKTIGDPSFGIVATSNSTGAISYSSSNASVATVNGNQVSLTGVGVTTLTATQAVDAHYLAGTATATLTVVDVAPSGLSYPSPNVYPVLSAIPALTPTVSGTVTGYSISPVLPTGLSINASTGVISGTPTQATSAIVYTVTAKNTAGSVSASVSIAVNKLTPTISLSNLSKTMGDPSFGITATSNSTGAISYSSSNASVATISGNQVSLTGVGVTTLTATQTADPHYLAGTATATLTVVDVAPSGLSYPGPNVYPVLSAIASLTPIVTGTVTGYTISPALPTGLSMDALTGVISGTPTQATAAIVYAVTASNTAGSVSAIVSIAVNKLTPTISLSNLTKTMGDPSFGITANSNSTGAISYSSSNASVATIIGNQVSLTGVGVSTLTATQVADAYYLSGTATATLTVNAAAWVGISYPSPNVYTVNTSISPLVPTIGGTATAFVISPALPAGLSISATTGIISGTPTQVSVAKDYTVTATINGNSYTAVVNITVKDIAPTGLSYPSPNVYPVLSAIPALTPTVTGTVTGYTISPALPTGLNMNASTGVISGTPTQSTAVIVYTVTASNTAGSISATVSIAVSKLTPTISLSSLTKTKADPSFGITANSNSTGAISYTSSNASVATISGNQVSLTGVGVTTLTASQAADAHYLAGTATATLTVGDVAPSGLSYPGPNVYPVLSAIPALTPTVSGTVTGYSISPALPKGLSINASTGVISGTPIQATAAIVYTVTANNTAGSINATVSIAVNKLVPTISMNNIRKTYGDPDFSIAAISNSPGKINYAINIASIATISGNIVTLKSGGIATITASQVATDIYEAATVKAQLLVNPLPKNGFEYPLMNILTIDKTIQPIKPMIQGVLSGFSISPALPAGLTIDSITGYIIGTPTVLSKLTEYTVIATDGMLSLQAILNIQVNDIPPVFKYQPDRDIANPRLPIKNAVPLSTGGKVVSYSINPALPIGIQLNAQTGLISGKIATVRNGVQEYLVTGTNSGGVATAKYSLVFNSAPTDILLSNYQVLENIPSGSQIGILNVADIDDGDTHNYQLVSGVGSIDNSHFEIRNNVLVSKSSFNYEQKYDYQIRIKVTDEGGLVYEKSFHIFIIDVNEVPTLAAMGDIRVYNLTSEQVIGLSNMSAGNDLNQSLEVQLSSNKTNLFESFKVVGNQILFTLKPDVFGNDVIIKVLVKDNGGISNGGVDTIARTFVLGIDPLPKVTASPDQVSLGKTTQLEVEAAHAIEYRWKNATAMIGSSVVKNPVVRPIQDGQFAVTVKNKWGYTADGSVKVNVVMDYALESNNILTPNGDGHNDRWMIANIELYPDNEVAVYDKAGKLVYKEKGYRNQWDGKLQGVPLKDDAYFYIIQFNKPNVKPIKGYLTIIH